MAHTPSAILDPAGRLLLLTGPTAGGKSEVALLLAERFNGEIVSVDSMQVYRGLDIGTAKPLAAERQRVPHHLIDVADLHESFSAAHFARLAGDCVRDITARGRLAILCGGTGFYFKAFLEGLGTAPPANPALRAELNATPLADLLRELAARDPAAFAQIDRRNPRRVVRALEVIRQTGRPFSAQRASRTSPRSKTAPLFFGLSREPQDLRHRIEIRVDAMFARGLVQETRSLLEQGLATNATARQALGYRQVADYLAGHRSLAETIALVKTRTWQYARRQMTWCRHQARLRWLRISPDQSALVTAALLATQWRAKC